jgi:hypothetical protein
VTRRGRVLLLFGLAVAAGTGRARAGEPTPDLRPGLYLEYEYFSYRTSLGGDVVDDRNAITAQPRLDWNLQDTVRLHAAVTARKDWSEESRTNTYAHEFFFAVERERWSLTFGREVVTWGRSDTFRPTDVFKRHDYTDLIEDRVEGTDLFRADWTLGPGTLEGVWAPILTADIVSYAPENRWTGLPTSIDVPGTGTVALTFEEDPHQTPANTFSASQVGARWSATAGGWDYAGIAYYGYDRVPTFTIPEVETFDATALTATVRLTPIHERITVAGGDFAKAIAAWTVRGEAAYTWTADPDPRMTGTNEPFYRFSGGADRTIASRASVESLWFSFQYAFDSEPEQTGPPDQLNVNPLLHPFRHALIVNSIWKFTNTVQLNLKGYLNLVDDDYLVQPEVAWKPIDAMTVVVGGDVLGGSTTTFFGRFRDNDRVRLRLSYTF